MVLLRNFTTFNPLMMPLKYSFSGWIVIAAILGVLGVAIGAIAAHAMADPKAIAAVEKAALYQLIHVLALLFASRQAGRFAKISCWFFLLGITLFCGSIALKYLLGLHSATAVAPSGGVCLMLGWVFLGVSSVQHKKHSFRPS
jgi:uncharacterized membrane protein YgdD (TMEM256/DUF423 family)